LGKYINDSQTDFYNARKIVNGLDQASTIQGIAVKFANALLHLVGGIDGVGQSKDLVASSVSLAHKTLDAMGQNGRFPCACAGDDEHGSIDMFDRFALALIRSKRGTESRLRDRHCGQNIT